MIKTPAKRNARIANSKTNHSDNSPSQLDPDSMVMDEQTIKDLEIFESEVEGKTLFDLCNHTRNKSGAEALRVRMSQPWSSPQRIQAVQESLSFILEHRMIFDKLPTFVTTEVIDRYLHGMLPLVMSRNKAEFFFGVLEIRFGDTNRYSLIMRGVDSTSSLIHKLRSIAFAPELAEPSGEIATILEEMRSLLDHESLSQIPDQEVWSLSAWKILRIDQTFRIYQKHTIARLMQLTYEIDALLSMAETIHKNNFIMPKIEQGSLAIQAEGLVHPLVPLAVANPVNLDQQRRLLFLTGPNMAGKTTYLRASAIALYLAHLGMGVPADSFSFVPAQRLFSSITLADNLRDGVSFFRAEGLRVKAIAQAVSEGYRVIALMDEPFKGTNIKDAFDASLVIMESLAAKQECLFMFSSHLIELCDQMSTIEHVDCCNFEALETEESLEFEYKLRPGVSTQRLGMRVLREEGIFDLLNNKPELA